MSKKIKCSIVELVFFLQKDTGPKETSFQDQSVAFWGIKLIEIFRLRQALFLELAPIDSSSVFGNYTEQSALLPYRGLSNI